MSIVATVKVYDGIVLGSDSATIIESYLPDGTQQFVKHYQNAKKLFRIGNGDIKVAALTYGLGNIGIRSIESVITEFNKDEEIKKKISSKTPVKEIGQLLLEFIKNLYDKNFINVPAEKRSLLGFVIAGFSDEDIVAQEWEFIFPQNAQMTEVKKPDSFGASWRGVTMPFGRLYKGFDVRLVNTLIEQFKLDSSTVEEILRNFESRVAYNGMPLQDAIDFLNYILLTTINFSKFEIGVPLCSEPIDVVVITRTTYESVKTKSFHV